jgi:hypothetical protein
MSAKKKSKNVNGVLKALPRGGKDEKASAKHQETEVPLLQWTAGKSTTVRRSRDSERLNHIQPAPRPPAGEADEGDVDNSYQVAQSMVLKKTYQAFDFKVLMLWDLLRLQRRVSDKLHSMREAKDEDRDYNEELFEALAEYSVYSPADPEPLLLF